MPKVRLTTRSVTNSRPSYMTLNMECIEEPLSEAQLTLRSELKENYEKVLGTLEEMIKEQGAKLICQAGNVNGYQYTLPPNPAQKLVKTNAQALANINQSKNSKNQPLKLNVLNNANNSSAGTSTATPTAVSASVTTPTSVTGTSASSVPSSASSLAQGENYKYTRSGRRTKVLQVQQVDIIEEPTSAGRGRQKPGCPTHVVTPTTTSPQGVTNLRIKTVGKQQIAPNLTAATAGTAVTPITASAIAKPTEHTCIGGISVGNKNAACEQIDEAKKNLPDGREITFNKMNGGRTYPSLVVVARPNLRTKDIAPQIAQKERTELDMKVKSVLMFSATKFAEWLIQQGLVRSEQYCTQNSTTHSRDLYKSKLKLGMYSDQGTFPYSGGYVWISSCCPERFVSVFSGSIFQGASYTPTVLLKLIYHWACQTNVQNVVSWVKVSNIYVKNFYTNLRSVCTAAVWDKTRKMGGKNSMIQVGVISLGTTSQDGNLRQVKVEVLGVLDLATLDLRLRACDPVQDGDRSYKRRFNNILHPLKEWVHTDSKIMTDFTVDKNTLQEMGFTRVIQSAFSDQNPRNFLSNYHIMEYLRKIVPRMFQNTLSLLSRQMIQQFLDELVWREMFGSTAARAFDNIILHIAEQTRINGKDANLLDRLAKIAANPFQDWSYSANNPPPLAPLGLPLPKELIIPTADHSYQSNNTVKQLSATAQETTIQTPKPGPKKGRKRTLGAIAATSPEPEVKRGILDPKCMSAPKIKENAKDKEKTRDNEDINDQQIQLQELYYATMEGEKNVVLKENKNLVYFKCFLCTTTMRSNTEVMEHMISHVPPRVPGQSDTPVCRYCCTAFSSQHQMVTHVTEAHSNFGHSASDMVVCAICEEKFGNSGLLVNHLSSMHYPSEMPYRCESCGYRTSSHKDAIDHFYRVHEKTDGLQCPYCLKVMQFANEPSNPGIHASSVHAFFLHMQRHHVRREQGRGNKCSRCCLWFNQRSALKLHQTELHDCVSGSKVIPYSAGGNGIMISKQRAQSRRFDIDDIAPESPLTSTMRDDRLKKWATGPIRINLNVRNLSCQECEEDIDEQDHYPGEQRCQQCRYVTCCWRAFREHQQQVHNERPMTSLVIPSPLINIPLDKKMQCSCGYATTDGNQLAVHLVRCLKMSANPIEDEVVAPAPSGMLDSLGLVPITTPEETDADKRSSSR